eukprot:TRINITY_DN212_c0_g4_i3.p1 TRINITY_DN212_c0_g4~~TRINITY_DN212_c0_g4_i3.p1  ORF type:complete len:481 (+),score=71.33 TRINITY_DN212_c0_g4_i3:204-1646(+)
MSSRYQLIEDDDEPYEPVQQQQQQSSTHPAQPAAPSSGGMSSRPQPQLQGGQHVSVVVPPDWQHGQQLQIPTPSGTQVVDVPQGMGPGQQFRVQLPDSGQGKLSVTVPQGMGPGQEITVRAPNGQLFKATIPAGYGPGNTFYMAVPTTALQNSGGHQTYPQQQQQQQQHHPAPDPAQINAHAAECAASMKETAGLLEMMLGALEPGEDAKTNEIIQDLVQTCRTSTGQSERYVQDISEESVLMALLESNDAVCTALMKYESIALAGPQQTTSTADAAAAAPAAAPNPAPSVSEDLADLLGSTPPSWAAASVVQQQHTSAPPVRQLPPPAPAPAPQPSVPAWGSTNVVAQQQGQQPGVNSMMMPPSNQPPAQQQPPAPIMQASMPMPAPAPMPPPTWAATAPAPAFSGQLAPIQNTTPAQPQQSGMMQPTPVEPAPAPSAAVQRAAATEQKLDGDVNDILADFDSLINDMDGTSFDGKPKQ